MSDRLLKESDVMRIAFQLPCVVNSVFFDAVKALPSADRPQGKEMTNSEWKEFLAEQWGVSKACAKEMLHAMYAVKEKDSIKKGFDKRKGADDE